MKLSKLAERLSVTESMAFVATQQLGGGLLLLFVIVVTALVWRSVVRTPENYKPLIGPYLFFTCSFFYLLYSYVIKGFFIRPFSFGQSDTAYLPLLIIMAILWRFSAKKSPSSKDLASGISSKQSLQLLLALIVCILFIALISIQVHDGLGGMQTRF